MIHSVILMGQSNMSGRGNFGEVEPIFDERIQVLRCGKWRTMRGPVNPEDHKCEVSLAESFAASYAADHPEDMVGLVPCSFCGSSLDQWAPGELLYDHAVAMTKLAQRTSTVVAILWHQGECDCLENLHGTYETRFLTMINQFRKDTGLEDVPVVMGELGPDLLKKTGTKRDYTLSLDINRQIRKLAQEQDFIGYVPSEGLTNYPNNVHFDSVSLRRFGLRYYAEFQKLEKTDRVFVQKEDPNKNRSGMENI